MTNKEMNENIGVQMTVNPEKKAQNPITCSQLVKQSNSAIQKHLGAI